jgi:DNA polymerase-3 subunit alpha
MKNFEKSDPFIHLRLHSSYSLLQGAIRPEELPKLCQKNLMPAVGVTDTGNLFGALEISELLVANGIQPLIGCEFKFLQNNINDQNSNYYSDIILLAQNEDGYKNLLKLSSEFFLNQKSPKLALDLSQLEKHSNDLILLCGGSSGILGANLLLNRKEEAKKTAVYLKKIFGDRFYIEIQRHGQQDSYKTKEEEETEDFLLELADDNYIPIVATNNVHFKDKKSFEAQDVLSCIAQNAYLDQEAQRERLTQEHYFKSSYEMKTLFGDLLEAYNNTLEIAVRCTFKPSKREPILPKFAPNEKEELKRQAEEGLQNRIKTSQLSDNIEVYQKRLSYELQIIEKMGFPGYFLIVADFVQWSKKNKIPVGPGRGSGAGSLVAYCLTITDLDPIKYGLLFERFLNPERVSMPDFDIDFCQDRREEVIQYVQKKYGKDRVAQIITFGGLLSKAAIRDVGRVLQLPYPQVDKIAKLIPTEANKPVSISKALKEEPRLEEEKNSSETVRRMLEYSLQIEGLLRNASTHAAGIVIGDRPLVNYVPLYQDSKSEMPATQFSMKWAEASGLVKFDFLGLKTLTIIQNTINLLEKRGINIDIESIPLDDKKTFELYSSARTMAVFQVESSGMRAALTQLKPNCLEDIIALVALYRPGPMENIPKFCRVKNNLQDREFIHPSIDTLLDETQGIIIYQEQVMEIARKMAGYSLGEADLLRRAMGKKIKKDMDAEKPRFISGALKNKIDNLLANRVWLLLERFANYGFNKSHAAAYALVSYQTCWLKANYPVEFMAAVMNNDINFTDKLSFYKQEVNELGILLTPPSINKSVEVFSVDSDKIIYALGALKNVGIESMRNIISVRNTGGDFKDIFDFANRVELRKIGKRSLEMLIYAGVFDEISNNRNQLFQSIEILVEYSNICFSEKYTGQNNLFGETNNLLSYPDLKLIEDWNSSEKLKKEYEAIGFYLSAHPLDDYAKLFKSQKIEKFSELNEILKSGPKLIKISGSVLSKQERISSKGNKFAFIQFSDPSGFFEVTAFSDILDLYNNLLQPSQNLILSCQATLEENQPKLLLRKVEKISDVLNSLEDLGIRIFIDDHNAVTFLKEQLEILNNENLKKSPIKIVVISKEFDVELDLPNSYRITNDVINSINHIPGVLQVERFDNHIC